MSTLNLQEKIAERFAQTADKVARQMADKIGVPSDSQDISLEEEVKLWNDSPHLPEDIPLVAQELLNQNMPLDQIVDNIYPNRRKMFMQGRPNPKEWVEFSDKMTKLTEEIGEGELPNVDDRSGNTGQTVPLY